MSDAATPVCDLRDVPSFGLPLALAELHRATEIGARVNLRLAVPGASRTERGATAATIHGSAADWASALLEGAGFETGHLAAGAEIAVVGVRLHTLADIVGPGMRLLVCGLNPSPYAADVGIGFARPGNRFWPAALGAGIVDTDRDPLRALTTHGIGFTDLVKRTTRRASELSPDEYRHGSDRVRFLAEWLEPGALCFVGLSGYRAAVDRAAIAGWQNEPFGSRPAYVMPNPSGINAHTNVDQLTDHLRVAVAGPG